MTENLFSAIGWCVMQVSLVALVGVVISLLFARRQPFVACSLVCMASLVAAMLTFLAPLPAHRWFVLETRSSAFETKVDRLPSSDAEEAIASSNSTDGDPDDISLFNLRDLALAARSLAMKLDRIENRSRPIVQNASWLLLAMILIGLTRFVVGIAFVVRIRKKGTPISDPKLLALLRELVVQLGCRTVPEIRESSEFTDAAVAGWFRPTLILPCEWRQWSHDERRAVIAHEIAHIVRHDTLWRAVASSVLAMHFYNPIVHWLLRRVMLYQELSADALATFAVGQKIYLRSLSSLAIRWDDQLGRSVSPDLLPVFSGQLIRRIKVLHSKEGSLEMKKWHRRNMTTAAISIAFLAMGLAALATRGIAQVEEQKANKDVFTELLDVTDRNYVDPDPVRGMFNHSPLDPSVVGENNRFGMAAFRVKEFLQRPEMQSQVPLLNATLSAALCSDLKLKVPPVIRFENIEWIAGRPLVTVTAKTKDKRGRLMFGAGGFVIKLNQPMNLSQWMKQYAPETKRHVLEGNEVFEFSISTLGPNPTYVWMVDETTIRTSAMAKKSEAPTKLSDLDLDPYPRPHTDFAANSDASSKDGDKSKWSTTWNQIDRGLFSAVLAKFDASSVFISMDHPEFQDEVSLAVAPHLRVLLSRCTMSSFSFDIAQGTSLCGFRVGLSHSSREEAVQSEQAIRALIEIAKKKVTKELDDLNNSDKQAEIPDSRLKDEMLRATTISISEYDDRTADVIILTTVPFAKFMQSMGVPLMAAEPSKTERR